MSEHVAKVVRQLSGIEIERSLVKDENDVIVDYLWDALKQNECCKAVRYSNFVNDLYLATPKVISRKDVVTLADHPVAFYVLSSGVMEEDDPTTVIICFGNGFYNIIDVKTRNLEKNAQPPNIISAYKLTQMCAYMIENEEFDTISIDYIGVDWREDKQNGTLVCEAAQHVCLFKIAPDELYINWAAALQVQFHPHNVSQSWQGSVEEWARGYLRHFVDSARQRCDTMREKFIDPFLKYIAQE